MVFEVLLCKEDGSTNYHASLGFIVGNNENNAASRYGLVEEIDNEGWSSRFHVPGTCWRVKLNNRREICNLPEMIELAQAKEAEQRLAKKTA